MRQTQQFFLALVTMLMVASCGVADLMPRPKTTAEAIGLTLTSITSARAATIEQLNTAHISVDEAERIQTVLNQARAICDLSMASVQVGNEQDAIKYLDMATTILTKVEEMLRERS